MKFRKASLAFLCVFLVGATAHATLFEDNFDDGAWASRWSLHNNVYGQTFTDIDLGGGNRVLQLAATTATPPGGAEAAAFCSGGQTYYVDNLTLTTDINILSGGGGGIFWGFEGAVGNEYYLFVAPDIDLIQIKEEPFASGQGIVSDATVPGLSHGVWYTVKVRSTGTHFEVSFGPQGGPLNVLFTVAQEGNHPGFQSHVRGQCGAFAENNVFASPATVWIDNFTCDGVLVDNPTTFTDDFENPATTSAQWAPFLNPTQTYESSEGSQALRLTAGTGNLSALLVDNGKLFFTDAFTLHTAVNVDANFNGGVSFGAAETNGVFSDYFVKLTRVGDDIRVELVEETSDVEAPLGDVNVAGSPGLTWYELEVQAGVPPTLTGAALFNVRVWPRGTAKPATPTILARQDTGHIGYRLISLGATSIWQNPSHSGLYDDFSLTATVVPATNTEPGTDVPVVIETSNGSTVGLTFDNITGGGSTQVDVIAGEDIPPTATPGFFQVQGGLYYDINTTCAYTGDITVTLPYDPSTPDAEALSMQIFHYDTLAEGGAAWIALPTTVDTVNKTLSAVVQHFSLFAVGALPQFNGFFQPINMPPLAMSVFKSGSTVPVKFSLAAALDGSAIEDADATIWIEYLGNDAAAVTVNETFNTALSDSGNAFRYDASSGQYIYNLKTKGLWLGLYRIHVVIYGGELERIVDIRLK